MKSLEIEVSGLSAYRAAERLRAGGVTVLSARRNEKNGITLRIDANERKKVFAILRSSCYNIEKTEERGILRLRSALVRAAGALLGGAFALAAIAFLQGRVLRVEVAGSGAYLEPQIRAVLEEEGVGVFSRPPEENALAARLLSLPRVGFCSVETEGGVLRVRVETSKEASPLSGGALLSPAAGTVEALFVLRGTSLVKCGDSVEAGQPLVEPHMQFGEEVRSTAVIAWAKISYPVSREYALPPEKALLQATLDFGQDAQLTASETEEGCLVEGKAFASAGINLG